MISCNLPYIADKARLPADSPTLEEIESAIEILGDTARRKVDLLEGEMVFFLANSTIAAAPQFYAQFKGRDNKTRWSWSALEAQVWLPTGKDWTSQQKRLYLGDYSSFLRRDESWALLECTALLAVESY
ncbi:hypothetical protein CC78DRAFT_545708 [Lojkania enalia]|uniref:Uncharacterized protein n=1 Tax=Lojkania enalia TaxID=147567 RepID=A0A9P4K635_9PLEO|nr:hypothetical protein CC78DRAFT_545708 [Didymosphaeria enalia]